MQAAGGMRGVGVGRTQLWRGLRVAGRAGAVIGGVGFSRDGDQGGKAGA